MPLHSRSALLSRASLPIRLICQRFQGKNPCAYERSHEVFDQICARVLASMCSAALAMTTTGNMPFRAASPLGSHPDGDTQRSLHRLAAMDSDTG
jgi:hypothetical protein